MKNNTHYHQLKGYLYKLDDSYFRCPKLCVYKTGMIEKSGKGNYYISLPKGDKVIFDLKEINKNNLHEGDVIHFTMTQDSKFKHKFSGSYFSKIEKDNTYCTKFLAKGIVKNNKSDNSYFVLVNDVRYNLPYKNLDKY